MDNLTNELLKLREESAEVAYILDVYKEIDSIYRESLAVMGRTSKPSQSAASSAEVSISFEYTPIKFNFEE